LLKSSSNKAIDSVEAAVASMDVMMASDGVTKLLKLFDNTVEEYPHDLNEKKLNEYNKLLKNVRTKWKKNSKLMMLSSIASQEKIINIILFYCRSRCN
jgi:hypothetical protein